MVTALLGIVAAFAYLAFGHWLGMVARSIWRRDQPRNAMAYLFFPMGTWTNELGVVTVMAGDVPASMYLTLMSMFWPLKFALNVVLAVCILVVVTILKPFFNLVSTPGRMIERTIESARARRLRLREARERSVRATIDAALAEPPPASTPYQEAPEVIELRSLRLRESSLTDELGQVRKRIATLEQPANCQ